MTNPTPHGQVPEALTSLAHEIFALAQLAPSEGIEDAVARISATLHAQQPAPATQQAPQQEAREPCPTCAALARTVMLDQVSFDRKPDCYGIRQITEDEGVEEWEDIRTSPDVAREEANDMMATGRGELYEVVPLWTTPQSSPTAQAAPAAGAVAGTASMPPSAFLNAAGIKADDMPGTVVRKLDAAFHEAVTFADAAPTPAAQADSVLEDAALLALTALHSCTTGGYTDVDGDFVRTYYFNKVAVDASIKALTTCKQGAKHD